MIKHYVIGKLNTASLDPEVPRWRTEVYLCNEACGVTKEKATTNWDEVTCKNCLRRKPKDGNKEDDL